MTSLENGLNCYLELYQLITIYKMILLLPAVPIINHIKLVQPIFSRKYSVITIISVIFLKIKQIAP